MERSKASVLASYTNPAGPAAKQQAKIVRISNRDIVVEIGNRTLTYHGCYAEYHVGDMVELPLKSHSWSTAVKWSPFDEPSEYDVDDE